MPVPREVMILKLGWSIGKYKRTVEQGYSLEKAKLEAVARRQKHRSPFREEPS
jgi:hypothetical protein